MREIILHRDLGECRSHAAANVYLNARRDGLVRRSGVFNVTSGRLHSWCDPQLDATILEARFDSRAWTGLT